MKLKTYTTFAIAAFALTAIPAFGQVSISRDGRPERIFGPASGLTQVDIHFLRQAAIANMFEIQTGHMAREKSSNPFVSEYAKEMIHEHELSLEELKSIAISNGISLPQDLPSELMMTENHLQNLYGDRFDTAYVNAQSMGHTAASLTFKTEIENGSDADVKAYAVKTLPEVMMHYRMLLNKQTMMGVTKMDHGN